MTLTHIQLRDRFKTFWEERGHREMPPIPLVPKDDPTTLFTGSGMQQLVPFLLGETHPLGNRLYNIQRGLRTQDIEEVGNNRHTTIFEMMGNWSLGDYFKEEQLEWCWEFLTDIVGLAKNKLYVTVFAGTKTIPKDTESFMIWKKIGIPESRIFHYGAAKNWWSRAGEPENMPAGEPGGPDSEVFYKFTKVFHSPQFGPKCHPNCNCGRFLEICNSVFMQYKKQSDGSFVELPKKNVDFGGGLERILASSNDNPDVFLTDVFLPILHELEKTSAKKYTDLKNKPLMRVISDHVKAATFLIIDGVMPSNKERGYVLRRLLRRALVKMNRLVGQNVQSSVFDAAIKSTLRIYHDIYFEEGKDFRLVQEIVQQEVGRFDKALQEGLKQIGKIDRIDGKKAFDLYQNYGFPLELTEELFREKGQTMNRDEFRKEFEKHQNLSRSASVGKFKGGLVDQGEQTIKYHTATHLLHQALFDVLGNDIRQEGSNITSERLRFDFYSPRKPTQEEVEKVEELLNKNVSEKLAVSFKVLPKEEAYRIGARSFFREKYPEKVKVYFIGSYSKEFCGGPHVKNTSEIGQIKIYKFEKIGGNIYRIYAK
ncbi:alanine--tRNA ligase [Candidatus Roizmanbacteria bacterium]|nr:alanine--tRNA ligase [Candidatus Roizmanbacteria bacterium]